MRIGFKFILSLFFLIVCIFALISIAPLQLDYRAELEFVTSIFIFGSIIGFIGFVYYGFDWFCDYLPKYFFEFIDSAIANHVEIKFNEWKKIQQKKKKVV